jgi:hypothetical protein
MNRIEVLSGSVEVFEDLDDSWRTSGLIILFSPKHNNEWFVRVSSSKDVKKRIPQLPNAYPGFDGGVMVIVRSPIIPLSDNELDWMEGLLFLELKDTDLSFTCSAGLATNTLFRNPGKIADVEDAVKRILEAATSEGYSIENQKFFNQPGYIGEVAQGIKSDRQRVDFGNVFELTATLISDENPRIRIEVVERATRKVVVNTLASIPGAEPPKQV